MSPLSLTRTFICISVRKDLRPPGVSRFGFLPQRQRGNTAAARDDRIHPPRYSVHVRRLIVLYLQDFSPDIADRSLYTYMSPVLITDNRFSDRLPIFALSGKHCRSLFHSRYRIFSHNHLHSLSLCVYLPVDIRARYDRLSNNDLSIHNLRR